VPAEAEVQDEAEKSNGIVPNVPLKS